MLTMRLRSCLFAFVGLSISTAAVSADDWPQWRGPDLNGISRETGWSVNWPDAGPPTLWRAEVGIGFSSVTVVAGRVFTLGNARETDTVWCFDAVTGRQIWKHEYPCELDAIYYEGGPGSTPTVDGDRVFTLSKRGHLFCFEAASGRVIWQKQIAAEVQAGKPRWGFAGSPLVEADRLILNVGAAGTAVDKGSGRVVWQSGTNFAGYATPVPVVLGGERCALIFARETLVAVKMKSGEVVWEIPWKTRWDINAVDPIVAGDQLFLSSFDRGGGLFRLNALQPPSQVWTNLHSLANHMNSAVLIDGHLYGVDGNTDAPPKDLRCVELATGKVKWQYPGLGLGSLMAADGKLIVLSDQGELVVAEASAERFRPLAQAQVLGGKCWTVPVLAGGRIWCRNAAGTLVCLEVSGKPRPATP